MTVQNIIGFQSLSTSSGQIVMLGEVGGEKTEIIRTSTQYAPSGNNVTLGAAGLRFDHPQDTKVTIIDWDRGDVQWSATATGSKSTIRAYPIDLMPDLPETQVNDSTQTTGYYFVRFNETIGNTNSDWSDPIPFGGFDDNTVWSIKNRALNSVGEVIDGNLITDAMLNEWLWEARRMYHKAPGKRPFRRQFNADIGNVTTGMYRVVLPADVENAESAYNVYTVRVGTSRDLDYYDKRAWDADYRGSAHATLSTSYSTGNQDLYLDNVRDFADSGSVTIEDDVISYSAKGVSGGTLRISVAGTTSHASGLDVWQNKSSGLPTNFTVWAEPAGSAYIYFNMPISSAYVNQNIWADYYRTLVGYDSDADILDEPNYDLFVYFLAAKIKHRKNKGAGDITQDSDYKMFMAGLQEALSTEYLSTEIRMIPNVQHLPLGPNTRRHF